MPLPPDGLSAVSLWLNGVTGATPFSTSLSSLLSSSTWSPAVVQLLSSLSLPVLRSESPPPRPNNSLPKALEELLSRYARQSSDSTPSSTVKGGKSGATSGQQPSEASTSGVSGSGSERKESGGSSGGGSGNDGSKGNKGSGSGSGGALGSGGSPSWPNGLGDPRVTVLTLAALLFLVFAWHGSPATRDEITFQEFRNKLLDQGKVDKLTVNAQTKTVYVQVKPDSGALDNGTTGGMDSSPSPSSSSSSSPARYQFAIGSVEAFERALDEAQKELGLDPRDYVQVKYAAESTGLQTVSSLVQLGIMIFLIWSISRGMGAMSSGGLGGTGGKAGRSIFSIGKSPATLIKPGDMTKVTFADVAGLDEAKVEVMEFVKFLQSPEQFTRLGARIPKGALLCGPPGTGQKRHKHLHTHTTLTTCNQLVPDPH